MSLSTEGPLSLAESKSKPSFDQALNAEHSKDAASADIKATTGLPEINFDFYSGKPESAAEPSKQTSANSKTQ